VRKPFNKTGAPRKLRSDCKFFRLPPAGQEAFLAAVVAQRVNPNVEQLRAIAAAHGVDWSTKNIYEFLASDRLTEQLITADVRANVRMGETLADAGADRMTTEGRRVASAHYTTVIREAKFLLANPQADDQQKRAAEKRIAEASDMLIALGALKAGEDKGLIATAKLEIEREKLNQSERKLQMAEAKLAAIAEATQQAREQRDTMSAADRQAVLDRVDEIMGVRK
jgi:hypothetical protein